MVNEVKQSFTTSIIQEKKLVNTSNNHGEWEKKVSPIKRVHDYPIREHIIIERSDRRVRIKLK